MGLKQKRNNGKFCVMYPHSLDDNLLSMYAQGRTIPEISKETGMSCDTIRRRLTSKGANLSAVRYITSKGGYRKSGRNIPWTDEMVKKLIELYPTHTNIEIAEILQLTESQVIRKSRTLKLYKDAEWLKNCHKEHIYLASIISRKSKKHFSFQKCNTYGKEYWKRIKSL